jgi:hypothetical protein
MPHEPVLDVYLDEVGRIRATKAGTAETSYYPAIAMMLNKVGDALRPKVFSCITPAATPASLILGFLSKRNSSGMRPLSGRRP